MHACIFCIRQCFLSPQTSTCARISSRVQTHVGDLRISELVGHFGFFRVEHNYVLKFSTVNYADIDALVAHSGFRQACEPVNNTPVMLDPHWSLILSGPVTVFGCVPFLIRTSTPPPG